MISLTPAERLHSHLKYMLYLLYPTQKYQLPYLFYSYDIFTYANYFSMETGMTRGLDQ